MNFVGVATIFVQGPPFYVLPSSTRYIDGYFKVLRVCGDQRCDTKFKLCRGVEEEKNC